MDISLKALSDENKRLKEILFEIADHQKEIDKLLTEFYEIAGRKEEGSISDPGDIKKILDKYSRL